MSSRIRLQEEYHNVTAPALSGPLALPVVASPLFIVSGPQLVAAQCAAGVIGSFPP